MHDIYHNTFLIAGHCTFMLDSRSLRLSVELVLNKDFLVAAVYWPLVRNALGVDGKAIQMVEDINLSKFANSSTNNVRY